MPQVDLETLVSACSGGSSHDRKVACETQVDGDNLPRQSDLHEIPSDIPPESFWLSKDAEFDWFDRNAFLERKESTKGANSSCSNANTVNNPNSNNSSQRFSVNLKGKASIIGLPKSQKSCFRNTKNRRNNRPAANVQLFPKKPQPISNNKSSVPFSEPTSPKVSCMGRVRSKRDKNRRLAMTNRQQSSKAETVVVKPESRRKTGIWKSFRSVFGTGCRHKPLVKTDDQVIGAQSPPRQSVTMMNQNTKPPGGSTLEPVAEAPGLGGMKRFVSGRRSGSWTVDEIKDVNLTKS